MAGGILPWYCSESHDDHTACRIGQAKHPGPAVGHSFDSPEVDIDYSDDEPPPLCGDLSDEEFHLPDDMHYEEVDEGSPVPLCIDKLCPHVPIFIAGKFSGARVNMVYTTRRGLTGYYPDTAARDDGYVDKSGDIDTELDYLRFVFPGTQKEKPTTDAQSPEGRTNYRCPISISALLYGSFAPGLTGHHRLPRGKVGRRKRGPRRGGKGSKPVPPTMELYDFTGIPVEDDSHRSCGLWAVDTANTNTSATAQAYMEKSAADFALFQEMRIRGAAIDSAVRAAKSSKWSLAVEGACPTEADSSSAGVAVAARAHLGHSDPVMLPGLEGLEHRVRISWVGSVIKGGLHLISVYLWHTEGLSRRNLDILQRLAWVISRIKGPWLIAGDWNMLPEALRASGWINLIRGVICASGKATCNSKEFDFFVVSQGLHPCILGAFHVTGSGVSPHTPVRLLLRAKPRSIHVQVLRPPYKIPAFPPRGCLPPEAFNGWDTIVDIAREDLFSKDGLDKSFCSWIDRVESLIAGMCMLEGHDIAKMQCRSEGPKIVYQPAVGKPGSMCPRVSAITTAWRSLDIWIADVIRGRNASPSSSFGRKSARAAWHIRFHDWGHLKDSKHSRCYLQWVGSITPTILSCNVSLTYIKWATARVAKSALEYDRAQANTAFKSWLTGDSKCTNSRMHHMTRVQAGWIPSSIGEPKPDEPESDIDIDSSPFEGDSCNDCELEQLATAPRNGQDEVNATADGWATEWGIGTPQPQIDWDMFPVGDPLPNILCDSIRRAASTFPVKTGLGWDKFHPRAILSLPDGAILALIRIFILIELLGAWPASIGITLICLIPKTDGGRRPIGLLPSFIRLWMRVRLDVARTWQTENDREYFYAGPSKGATVAAWKQAARAELSSYSTSSEYVNNLLDLIKAFDRVPHDFLAQNAHEFRYPIMMLKLSIAAYKLGRVIVVEGICSYIMYAVRGITAGSVLATVELRVLLIKSVDLVIYRHSTVDVTVYVDDTSIESYGHPKFVVPEVIAATKCLVNEFTRMRLGLSDTKNICCASKLSLAQEVIRKVPGAHLKPASQAKSLGAAISASKRRNVSVFSKRLAGFRARKSLYLKVRKTVGAKQAHMLIRTGGLPALTYGQATTGVSCTQLYKQRVSVSAAANPVAGDLDISLCVMDGGPHGKVDPAFAAHTGPIVAWAMAIWDQWMPRMSLEILARGALTRLKTAERKWSAVHGPAGACFTSLSRLDWEVHNPFQWTDDRGNEVDLRRDSPAFIDCMVCASVRRWRWRRVEARHPSLKQGQGGYGVHMHPLIRLCYSCKGLTAAWGFQQAGALRSAMASRQWPQVRLYKAGYVKSPCCMLCVNAGLVSPESEDPKYLGSLTHRLWTCPVLHPFRILTCPKWLLDKVLALLRDDYTLPPEHVVLYTRALHKSVEPLVAVKPRHSTFNWRVRPPAGGIPAGWAYADGSRLFAEHKYCGLLARQGWAFAVIDNMGVIVAAASGITPWWAEGIYAAELWALLNAAEVSAHGTYFHVDCKAVQLGTQNGTSWATAACRKLSRAWAPLASILEDSPEHVAWMLAHCTKSQAGKKFLSDGRPLSRVDIALNDLVDHWAKSEAKLSAPTRSERARVSCATVLVESIGRWIGQCTVYANSFPVLNEAGKASHIRDSSARSSKLRAQHKAAKPKPADKRKRVVTEAVDSFTRVPFLSPQPVSSLGNAQSSTCVFRESMCQHQPRKKVRFNARQAEARNNLIFYEYWAAERLRVPAVPSSSPSGAVKLKAMQERIALKFATPSVDPSW